MREERSEIQSVNEAVTAEFSRAGAAVPGGDMTADADALLRLHASWILNNWGEWTQGIGADGAKTKTKLPARDLSRILVDNVAARIKLKGEGDTASFGERLDKLLATIKQDDELGPEYDGDSPIEIPDSDVVFGIDGGDDDNGPWPVERRASQ